MSERKRSAEDFAEEMQAHIDLEAEELRREGLSEADAERQARRTFGSVRREQERFYLQSRWVWLDKWMRDLKHALRSLVESPGFTVTAIVTLALGVGANTAVFSVMHAVLLKALPVADPDRVVYLRTSAPPNGTGTIETAETFSYADYDALRGQTGAMATVLAYVPLSASKVAVRIGTQPEEAEGDMVSGDFFSALAVTLQRGRGFTEADEKNHAPLAVISDDYWTRRFARNPEVLGVTLAVNGDPFTIVGVAARGFEGLEAGQSTDFWIPLQSRPELNAWGNPPEDGKTYMGDPTWWCLRLIGRLAPGVTRTQAVARLQPVFQVAAYDGLGTPGAGEKKPVLSLVDAKGFPGYAEMYGNPLRLLMGLVGLVLLIALTNVAMLLMARNAARQREFSMKLALGAGRRDLLRQLLAESSLLAAAGGLLAWFFAVYATRALGAWAQIESSLSPDGAVLRFTVGVLAVAVILFGAAPLRIAMAAGPVLAIKTSAAVSSTDTGKTRVGRAIVVLQMTVCVVLLVAAALLIRTLRDLEQTPLGFNTDGLVVFDVKPDFRSLEQGREFYRDLTGKLRGIPGVESMGLMMLRIGSGASDNNNLLVDGKLPVAPNGGSISVRNNVVGPDFFKTLGVPLLAGREFRDSDTAAAPLAGIVNEEFARRFLKGENPLGHTFGPPNMPLRIAIVGMVKDHKFRSIDEAPVPMAWYDYAQIPVIGRMGVEMRVHGDPLAILPTVRKVVQQMDPNLPLIEPMTQRAQYDLTISYQVLFARLAGFFGLVAVLLVAAGLYGTLAYRVSRRTAEIGIRMAMGARRGQVVWMILKDSLLLTAIGVAAGVPLAMLVGRALGSSLYGVTPLDGASYAIAVLGVTVVALAASAWPARRAAGVEPLTALRAE